MSTNSKFDIQKSNEFTGLKYLIAILVTITILYQLNAIISEDQYTWITTIAFIIFPTSLTVISFLAWKKLYQISSPSHKAFLFFFLGLTSIFIAEQLWLYFELILEIDPFPSLADVFYLTSYPLIILFLVLSLKPFRNALTRKSILFSLLLSGVFLISPITSTFDSFTDENSFEVLTAVSYPIFSAAMLFPAILGMLFFFRHSLNIFWILLLFGLIAFTVADIFFLLAVLDDSYFDGHPSDLLFLYSYTLLAFSMHHRLKFSTRQESILTDSTFDKSIRLETITKFGLPITLMIASLITIVSIIQSMLLHPTDNDLPVASIATGIVVLLAIFSIIIIVINKNLNVMIKMRTKELEEQRDNLEKIIDEKTNELVKTERLTAIGELSGRLAHDLRNPLSVIKMSVNLLQETKKDLKITDENVVKKLDLISKSIDRISHQVDDVLGFVRNSPVELSNANLSVMVATILSKISLPSGVEINTEFEEINLKCDPIKIEAVFTNIIINASQAMDGQGKIFIRSFGKNNTVIIEFENSGPSIPNDMLTKIFEPLFTTKQKGTGLGLASCKNILEQHGGTISVENNPTKFIIELPKSL